MIAAMKRREFITLLGAAAAWPLAARAQQPAMPAIGFLGTSTASSPPAIGFHRGLGEAGFVEGRNIAVEYRFSEGRYDQLSALVAELVGRNRGDSLRCRGRAGRTRRQEHPRSGGVCQRQ